MAASERDESLCLCVATMRLLAFSDIHRDLTQAGRLVDGGGDVEVVVVAGDFASVHRGLDELIGVLAAIETPTVVVAGNNETDVVLSEGDAGMAGQRGLAVVPWDVGQAGAGRLVAGGAVGSGEVVVGEPGLESRGAVSAGLEDLAVGPFSEEGLDEALGLAVGAWPVGLGAQVS